MIGYIYKITNTLNNKVYIGQTIQTVQERWYRHCGKGYSEAERNMAIKKAIFKYGKENFTIETIETCSLEDLNDRETYYIKYYNSYNNGYNSTFGGQKGFKSYKTDERLNVEILKLYRYGFSLREIGREFILDKATVKGVLVRNNEPLRTSRTYKLSQEDRKEIIYKIKNGISRKDIIKEYHISKSYLSQLITGNRRI